MTQRYPGIPSLAKEFWADYTAALIGAGLLVLIAGSAGGLFISQLFPNALPFYTIAAVSLVIHFAAMFLKDVWAGEYEPSQSTWANPALIFAVIVILGVQISGILLISTGAALAIVYFTNLNPIIAVIVAAFYPVVDFALIRSEIMTPGLLLAVGALLIVEAVFNIRDTVAELIPVLGRRYRPQS